MNAFFSDTFQLLGRHVRTTLRQPIWIAVMLVQPIIWLTLFGQLFRRVVELPGFETTSYLQFILPGVVIMTAFFSALWAGMGMIEDHNEGVLDRLLATPVHRGALIAGRVLHTVLVITVQSLIILVLGLVLGAHFPGGIVGFVACLVPGMLLGAGISALSNGLALLARREETLIAVANFFGMPLVFLSTAFMAAALMPEWIRTIAQGNPVNWAVEVARAAVRGQATGTAWIQSILLAVFVLVAGLLATQAFRIYRHTT